MVQFLPLTEQAYQHFWSFLAFLKVHYMLLTFMEGCEEYKSIGCRSCSTNWQQQCTCLNFVKRHVGTFSSREEKSGSHTQPTKLAHPGAFRTVQHSSAGLVHKAVARPVALQHDVVLVLHLQPASIALRSLQGSMVERTDCLWQLLPLCLKPGLHSALCHRLQGFSTLYTFKRAVASLDIDYINNASALRVGIKLEPRAGHCHSCKSWACQRKLS